MGYFESFVFCQRMQTCGQYIMGAGLQEKCGQFPFPGLHKLISIESARDLTIKRDALMSFIRVTPYLSKGFT